VISDIALQSTMLVHVSFRPLFASGFNIGKTCVRFFRNDWVYKDNEDAYSNQVIEKKLKSLAGKYPTRLR